MLVGFAIKHALIILQYFINKTNFEVLIKAPVSTFECVRFFLDSVGKINKMLHELTNKITQKD